MASEQEGTGENSPEHGTGGEGQEDNPSLEEEIEMSAISTQQLLDVPVVVINSASGDDVGQGPAQQTSGGCSSHGGHSTTADAEGDLYMGDNMILIAASKTSAGSCSSTGTSNSIICRICHMSEKETGEALGRTECECRGGLETVHRSCLVQWVSYKHNNRCELCGVIFPSISPPRRSSSAERQRRRIEAVYQQYTRLRPMTRRKRAMLGSFSLFLVITTTATGILTVSTEREFERVHLDPWASGQARMDSYITFSICLSFLLFLATLTVGVLLIWLFLEGSYYRRRERFYNVANQVASQYPGGAPLDNNNSI